MQRMSAQAMDPAVQEQLTALAQAVARIEAKLDDLDIRSQVSSVASVSRRPTTGGPSDMSTTDASITGTGAFEENDPLSAAAAALVATDNMSSALTPSGFVASAKVRKRSMDEQTVLQKEQYMAQHAAADVFGTADDGDELADARTAVVPSTRLFVFFPGRGFRFYWDMASIVLVLFISWTLPFRLAFILVRPSVFSPFCTGARNASCYACGHSRP
jgi:hypothetical protein